MSLIEGINDEGALITETSVLMIKLLKKNPPKPEQCAPPIHSFHSLFYNYLKLT